MSKQTSTRLRILGAFVMVLLWLGIALALAAALDAMRARAALRILLTSSPYIGVGFGVVGWNWAEEVLRPLRRLLRR